MSCHYKKKLASRGLWSALACRNRYQIQIAPWPANRSVRPNFSITCNCTSKQLPYENNKTGKATTLVANNHEIQENKLVANTTYTGIMESVAVGQPIIHRIWDPWNLWNLSWLPLSCEFLARLKYTLVKSSANLNVPSKCPRPNAIPRFWRDYVVVPRTRSAGNKKCESVTWYTLHGEHPPSKVSFPEMDMGFVPTS